MSKLFLVRTHIRFRPGQLQPDLIQPVSSAATVFPNNSRSEALEVRVQCLIWGRGYDSDHNSCTCPDPQNLLMLPHKGKGTSQMGLKCCCSVIGPVRLCNPMDCSMPGSLSSTISLHLLKLMSIELAMLSNHVILCLPLLLLPSIFPSIRVFSKESGGPRIVALASTSVLAMSIQG